MKNSNNNIDKKGLQNLPQHEPRPELWDRIESALDRERKPKFVYWRWTAGIAATLALLLTINFLMRQAIEPQDVVLKANEKVDQLQQNTVTHRDTLNQIVSENSSKVSQELTDEKPVLKPVDPIVTNQGQLVFANSTVIAPGSNQEIQHWSFGDGSATLANGATYSYTVPSATYQDFAPAATFNNFSLNYTQDSYIVAGDLNGNTTFEWDLNASEADYDGVDDGYDNVGAVGFRQKHLVGEVGNANFDTVMYNGLFRGRSNEPTNSESYAPLIENKYKRPALEPLSTFGIDVDKASYAVMRTKLNSGQIVPKDAVRIEEFVNYFDYKYPQPTGKDPFSINMEVADCPWNSDHQLVRIGLKGKEIDYENLSASNLVFLIDVSGSMSSENKLPLVKSAMKLLVDQLGKNDRIAIVTYAGAAGLALPSTSCDEKEFIKNKIDRLESGGSTAGGAGIRLAYNVAIENLMEQGNNRVILCTDGDFNVGASSDNDMKDLIIESRNKGVFITVCGFGMGNYQDSKMETIADNGNGNYFYIDNYNESERVFKRDIRATLFTIAKDVKIQVEFNPKHVKAYRLIGYENRLMPPQDFNDDTKDGGELGAGHTVTALYEIILASSEEAIPGEIELKYQQPNATTETVFGDELLTIKLRYKAPREDVSKLLEASLMAGSKPFGSASADFQFASGVALFAQQLRQSAFVPKQDFTMARDIIAKVRSDANFVDESELLLLISTASNVYTQTTDRH